MYKIIFTFLAVSTLFSFQKASAQVGIGISSPKAALDITSIKDGLLLPRLALAATNVATVETPTASELVYNTFTSAAGVNQVTPGFYYWNGTLWVRLATGNNSNWTTTGNAGTVASTNFAGTTDEIDFVFRTNNLERARITSAGKMGVGTTTPASALAVASNTTIGATYAPTNAAPANGIRVEGQSVIGKASGEDTRDKFSAHTSATAFGNVTGYPKVTAKRAMSGYADADGIGVFGYSNRTGYGVVGLTQPNTLSAYIQTGEGVLGQADGSSGGTDIPIGVHGIIDESTAGNWKANGTTGENNNATAGLGFTGGSYTSSGVTSGVYGNYASKFTTSGTNAYAFGVAGDILKIDSAFIPDGSGGVFGSGGKGQFGMLGYNSKAGNEFCVYGGGANDDIASNNDGRSNNTSAPGNLIGLGINGGFMGGYVKGSQYGLIAKGQEFGMYVQGNTIVNEPIVQLIENTNTGTKTVSYTATSTEVDVTTRGNGTLKNGTAFVPFKEAFRNLVSKEDHIDITVTPTGETNGVYVSQVTAEGFYITENQKGTSNASFNWMAIGTRAGFENGVALSNTILANDFEKNMNKVMSSDGSGQEGAPIYFDGQHVRFERIPEGLVKHTSKVQSKK